MKRASISPNFLSAYAQTQETQSKPLLKTRFQRFILLFIEGPDFLNP
jgi:hypothetical protein